MGDYKRLRAAIGDRRLPLALIDLDALDHNIDELLTVSRAASKPMRIATKSIRCPAIVDYILERGGAACHGLMCYAVAEAALWVQRGCADVLVAYPSVQPSDVRLLAELNREASVSIVVDDRAQLAPLADAAVEAAVEIPLVVEADMSLSLGPTNVGVLRSPVRDPGAVADLAERIRALGGVRFDGVMAYEAQIAGVTDRNPTSPWLDPIKRAIKRASRPSVRRRREAIAAELSRRGLTTRVFNGGGTGSLSSAASEHPLTEVTAGSGFLCSHLFNNYRGLDLEPAALFALQVVRRPRRGVVTCHGGGYIASGEAGADRLPVPHLPRGLALTRLEGAGEVQTPLRGAVKHLGIGDPVFFRHAKAGELAAHFAEYLLVRGEDVVDTAPTYRGLGHRFL